MQLRPYVAGLFAMALSACSSAPQSAELAAAQSPQSSENTDVQILQAWRADAVEIDRTKCLGADPTPGQTVEKDCSPVGAAFTQVPWADRLSPTVNDWHVPYYASQGSIYSFYAAGHLVEIRALVKRAVLDSPVFSGVGFYFTNGLKQGVTFIPKKDLHVVSPSDVTLKSGEAAAVLRFVGWMPGYAGASGTSWCMSSVNFKPYARFEANGQTYENWEAVQQNHRIYRCANGGGTPQVMSFDRQAELLQ